MLMQYHQRHNLCLQPAPHPSSPQTCSNVIYRPHLYTEHLAFPSDLRQPLECSHQTSQTSRDVHQGNFFPDPNFVSNDCKKYCYCFCYNYPNFVLSLPECYLFDAVV